MESIWICGPRPPPVRGLLADPHADGGSCVAGGALEPVVAAPGRRVPLPDRMVVSGARPGLFPRFGFGETLFPTAGFVGTVVPPDVLPSVLELDGAVPAPPVPAAPVPAEPDAAPPVPVPADPPDDCACIAVALAARTIAVTMAKPIRFDIMLSLTFPSSHNADPKALVPIAKPHHPQWKQ